MKTRIVTLVALFLSASAQAATFTVTTDEDAINGACTEAKCSIRDAIIAANAKADSDTIIIPAGVYRIKLYEADDTAQSGDYDIIHDVSIVGAGMLDVTIQGMKKSRVFDVLNGARVSMQNISISDGYSDLGSGIYVSDGAMIDLKSVRIGDNDADLGGAGIYFTSSAESSIADSIIQNNKALGNGNQPQANGGGILIDAGSVSLKRSIVSENEASGYGGGIEVLGINTSMSIEQSNITKNKAQVSGGAIDSSQGKIDITNSVLDSNQATAGSGGALEISGTVNISTSTIYGNNAKVWGGGIILQGNGVLALSSVTLANNTALNGGGINSSNNKNDGGTIHNTIIANNVATGEGPNVFGKLISTGNNLLTLDSKAEIELQATDIQVANATAAGLGVFKESDKVGKSYVPLLGASPAINKGSCPAPSWTDQLGILWQGACDIGAAEAYCGDTVTHAANGEACDDGNEVNTDACLNTCKIAQCGDGAVQAGVEICDDGNSVDDDDCPNSCSSPTCGDKIVQKGKNEACDDGNLENTDACLNSCVLAKCGDGIVQKGVEKCDGEQGCDVTCLFFIIGEPPFPKDKPPIVPPGGGEGVTPPPDVGKQPTVDDKPPAPTTPATGGSGCSLIR